MTYFIIVFIQRFVAFLKTLSSNLIMTISIILLAFFNINLLREKQQTKQTLKQVKNARKIEEENSKLTNDELIDKL